MSATVLFVLSPDRKGALWDVLLYVPTVVALVSIAIKFWYGGNQVWAYLFFFLGSFFFIAGFNRIFSSRLMLMGNSPKKIQVTKKSTILDLSNGERIELVKNLRYFPDYAGKSVGLSGMDILGKQRQFVFHRGQFEDEMTFKNLKALLSVYR